MKVGYSAVVPLTLVLVGIAFAVAGFAMGTPGGGGPVGAGAVLVVIGVLARNRPAFRYDPETNTVSFLAWIGPVRREYGGAKGEQLVFEGDQLFRVMPDGKRKKLKLRRFGVRRDEVAEVADAIRSFEARASGVGK